MTREIQQLLKQLKTAKTQAEMARLTIKLLRCCGIYNPQGIAQEIVRLCVTSGHMGG